MSSHPSSGDSYDSDEPPELELDLGRPMECASEALHTRCTVARTLSRGANHEIFTLGVMDGEDGGDGRGYLVWPTPITFSAPEN